MEGLLMDEQVRRTTSDDAMLGRLDERTVNLALALKDLQAAHGAATRELKDSMHEVQESNKADTEKVIKTIQAHMIDDTTRFDRHDVRLKNLENWRWYILGWTAAIAFAISVLMWAFK